LKDDKQNYQWHHTSSNLAQAQDLSDVFDENYTPITTADIDLFAEKQKFLYAVLEAKVETAKGKAIINSHEKKFDAQKAYAELKNYHITSNAALFSANKIMDYLTSARINKPLIMITVKFPQKVNDKYINQKFRKMTLLTMKMTHLTMSLLILIHL
jgi:hypothetical protein